MSNGETPKKKSVFISHKMKDKATATRIVKELRIYAPEEKLEFFLSADIEKGEEWHQKIHDKLKRADRLILLYTDPTEKWDWCLYETGFFEGSTKKDKRHLICLHSEDVEVPKPLKAWQSVPALKDEVITLLKEIYAGVNPHLLESRERLEELAKIIIDAVGPRPTQTYCNKYLRLSLETSQVETLKETGLVPAKAIVKSNAESLKMFGLLEKVHEDWTWGEIAKELGKLDETGWISNLGIAMRSAIDNKDFAPCLPIFQSPKLHKAYRPVINRLDCLPDKSRAFKLIFVEIPSDEDPRPGGHLGTISTLMTISRKFRWGVIEKYMGQINRFVTSGGNEEDIGKCLEDLDLAIKKIETEGDHLGFFVFENVTAAFSKPEDKAEIKTMAENYGELKKILFKRMEEKKLQDLIDILRKMREINKDFLVRSAQRYHELLKEME